MKKILLGAALGGVVAAVILIIAGVIFFRTRMPSIIPSAWMAQRATGGGSIDRWNDDNYGPGMMYRQDGNDNLGPGMMNRRFDRGGYGPGMMGRGFDRGDFGPGMRGRWDDGEAGPGGWMHDAMVPAVAEKLGLSAEDLQTRLDGGETIYEVASAEGLTDEEFQTMMQDAHITAIDQALEDGKITQEQAEWMKERSDNMGFGRRGGFAEDCPGLDETQAPTTPEPAS